MVRFPFDDLSSSKVRPALCLAGPVGPRNQVVRAFITSRDVAVTLLPSDIVLSPNQAEFSQTGLQRSSTIRLHRLVTLGVQLITRELGVLDSVRMRDMERKLAELFQLAR